MTDDVATAHSTITMLRWALGLLVAILIGNAVWVASTANKNLVDNAIQAERIHDLSRELHELRQRVADCLTRIPPKGGYT